MFRGFIIIWKGDVVRLNGKGEELEIGVGRGMKNVWLRGMFYTKWGWMCVGKHLGTVSALLVHTEKIERNAIIKELC